MSIDLLTGGMVPAEGITVEVTRVDGIQIDLVTLPIHANVTIQDINVAVVIERG